MPIKIALNQFIDFTNSMGVKRISIARDFLSEPYSPQTDFYRPLRRAIEDFHQGGEKHERILTDLPNQLQDKKKRASYPALISAYLGFIKRHSVRRIRKSPRWSWEAHGLEVNINPELAVEIDGVPHIVKLWLRTEKIDRHRLPAVLAMMHQSLGTEKTIRIGVLDVRRKKLHVYTTSKPYVMILLRNEARALAGMLEEMRGL